MDKNQLIRLPDLPKEKLINYWFSLYEKEKQTIVEMRRNTQPKEIRQKFVKQLQEKKITQALPTFIQYINKQILYTFSPIWSFRLFSRLLESQEFRDLTKTLIDINARDSRINLREGLIKKTPSFTTQVGLILFLLGGALNFSKRSSLQSVFIAQTLPTLSTRYERLEWDTFHFSFKNNLESLYQKGNISWHDDCFIIETNRSENIPFSNSFMAIIRNTKTNQTQVLTTIPPEYHKIAPTTFDLHMDELPAKLGGLFPTVQGTIKKQRIKSEKRILKYEQFLKEHTNQNWATSESIISFDESGNYIIEPITVNSSEVPALPRNYKTSKIKRREKRRYRRERFKDVFNEGHKELKTALRDYRAESGEYFLETGIFPSFIEVENVDVNDNSPTEDIDLNTLVNFKTIVDTEESIQEVRSLIQQIDEHIVLPQKIPTRKMSSYRYPDMGNFEVQSFLFKNLLPSQKSLLRISTPPSFTTSGYYPVDYGTQSNFVIQVNESIQKSRFKNKKNKDFETQQDENVIVKKDYTMLVNTIRDWKIQPDTENSRRDSENYQSWLRTYLSTKNPLSFFKQDFSALYRSEEVSWPKLKRRTQRKTKRTPFSLPPHFANDWIEKLRSRFVLELLELETPPETDEEKAKKAAENGSLSLDQETQVETSGEETKEVSPELNNSNPLITEIAEIFQTNELEEEIPAELEEENDVLVEENILTLGELTTKKLNLLPTTPIDKNEIEFIGSLDARLEEKDRIFREEREDTFRPRTTQQRRESIDFRTFPAFPRNFQSNFQTTLAIPQFTSPEELQSYYKQYINTQNSGIKFKTLSKVEKTSLDLPIWRDIFGKSKIELPIIQIELPDKTPILEFSLEDKVDYQVSKVLGPLKKVSFEFAFPVQNLTESINSGVFNPVANYLRSLRKQESTKPRTSRKNWFKRLSFVVDPGIGKANWDTVDSDVWAGISRIGFWLVFYDLLKTWIQNCTREVLVFLRTLSSKLGFLPEEVREAAKLLFTPQEPAFQIIYNSPKRFKDIAGTRLLLPHIWKVIVSLRASRYWGGRHVSKDIPKALLLTGPPGTGKTLLVQAIGGETQIPVISLSGSSLFGPGDTPLARLELVFATAKRIAPCIIFIDEIDSLLHKRADMSHLERPGVVANLIHQPLLQSDPFVLQKFDMPVRKDDSGFKFNALEGTTFQEKLQNYEDTSQLRIQTDEHYRQEDIRQGYKYALLLQFLLELDQIKFRNDIFVIGATNRLDAIDAAALRPGRFDKILELGLPNEEKRLEIIKFYGNQRGFSPKLAWDFVVRRTDGFSAADLSAVINQSTLFSIFNGTFNSLETIETAIDRIITLEIKKPKPENKVNRETGRLAYYQAGKIILSALLEHHPPVVVAHLWPHRPNVRALQIEKNLYTRFFNGADRLQLEELSIGCYAGKAAEILFIDQDISNMSDFGMEDIQFGHHVIQFMVEKSFLYSTHQATQLVSKLDSTRNEKVLRPEQIDYFGRIAERFESQPFWTLIYPQEYEMFREPQLFFSLWWWERYVYLAFTMHERIWSHWIRYHFPIPVRRRLYNIEWIHQDVYFHGNELLKTISGSIKWNNLLGIHRDYQVHSLVLQSFNIALSMLDEHRELVDKLAYELVQQETLRDFEIQEIFSQFGIMVPEFLQNQKTSQEEFQFPQLPNQLVVTSSWGPESRRKRAKWIDFEIFSITPSEEIDKISKIVDK